MNRKISWLAAAFFCLGGHAVADQPATQTKLEENTPAKNGQAAKELSAWELETLAELELLENLELLEKLDLLDYLDIFGAEVRP